MNGTKRVLSILITVIVLAAAFAPTVLADTNGTEIQITDQPDKLVLQLGPQWAGVEFELKTDAGVFPVPVVVDESGVLKMDLGGSKNYTLSCLSSPITIPDPEATDPPATSPPEPTAPASNTEIDPGPTKDGIPTGVLIMFILGLLAAVGGLLAMRYFKHRRDSYSYDDDDDDYE